MPLATAATPVPLPVPNHIPSICIPPCHQLGTVLAQNGRTPNSNQVLDGVCRHPHRAGEVGTAPGPYDLGSSRCINNRGKRRKDSTPTAHGGSFSDDARRFDILPDLRGYVAFRPLRRRPTAASSRRRVRKWPPRSMVSKSTLITFTSSAWSLLLACHCGRRVLSQLRTTGMPSSGSLRIASANGTETASAGGTPGIHNGRITVPPILSRGREQGQRPGNSMGQSRAGT